jgi:hypothetical protein
MRRSIIEDSIHMPLGLCIRNAKKKQIDDMKDKKKLYLLRYWI